MFGKSLALLLALQLAPAPPPAPDAGKATSTTSNAQNGTAESKAPTRDTTKPDNTTKSATDTGGQSYGDRNRGGPYGFTSYPRHRHVDGGVSGGGLDRAMSASRGGVIGSGSYDSYYGSAYYGSNYGAPYYGGGYYVGGTYYRDRIRDREAEPPSADER